ncbi:hypothetical protein EDC14_10126 [Hydrogenispora ethanolica]|jgi:hypothetical protein|uniref:Uncharacterized protein n=1 Tax=Hydrogenispora ethanolica TaxID=1082276 RepID=A0A4R1RSL0_HYDET|nr:hypothetical protein [Hydrogenispora ethanolica]TCL69309.1 hypothetical protein EDC14_10126 [Hydrogenispora ethanolica]
MFWKQIWDFMKGIWNKLNFFRVSTKPDTTLDTAKVNLFGLKIEVTREVSAKVPHELSIVIPRAELRQNQSLKNGADRNTEIILSSITIAHSPRFERTGQPLPSPATPAPASRLAAGTK